MSATVAGSLKEVSARSGERTGSRVPACGRFAPTPSGPLHLGSLQTALASYLAARHAGGCWRLRIDDLDGQRCRREHEAAILRQLEAHALAWDGAVYRQGEHAQAYRDALAQLQAQGLVYACTCTRARLATLVPAGRFGRIYDGHCRDANLAPVPGRALRLRVPRAIDAWRESSGLQVQASLADEIGDFVIWRADGAPGYQLACAVDEGLLQVNEVVRGADLLGSTLCQRLLLALLGRPCPDYWHLPLRLDAHGRKLSKQNHAAEVHAGDAVASLRACLRGLGQVDPDAAGSAAEVVASALACWEPARVPRPSTAADVASHQNTD